MVALFLDIDGTLLDIAATPAAARIPDGLPILLANLRSSTQGAMALISGRSLAGIDRLFPGQADAAGSHGLEWRMAGTVQSRPAPIPEDILEALEQAAQALPGLMVERKSCSVALHYRNAPEHRRSAEDLAQRILAEAPLPLVVLEGKAVIELLPPGPDKGAAIARFMDHPPYAGRLPIFAGDDLTDERGFAAVNDLAGLSIHVGPPHLEPGRLTVARYRVDSPAVLRDWLTALSHIAHPTQAAR
jgi:trehalose 6-phosphate phosphatase